MKKTFELKRIALMILLVVLPIITINSFILTNDIKSSIDELTAAKKPDTTPQAKFFGREIANSLSTARKDSIKNEIKEEATDYVSRLFPKSPESITNYIVEVGLENDIDICFIMGQTQLETAFGTTGIGKTKKSLFGVKTKRIYTSYNDAIDHYVSLLKNSYLVNGKTEENMLNNYVTKDGYRYAERGYESHLRNSYNKVVKQTNIKRLQEEYNAIEG